ncbi:MAG: polysaccharide deacetylase family protein [Methylacidiphilales bacterium]|nr:polysaccharide deacetylase family protein [Candidatus Methylacidiphilales bacterium]
MTESAAQKSLIVSLHDAHPGSRGQIADQVAFLARYGITRSSILVVPEFHHGGSVLQDRLFCDVVSGWQAGGHEIVLHGYFHDRRESPPEKLSTVFWTRFYTNREAEFLDLPEETARQRLEKGRALFKSLGWRATGFVAPAWLMAGGITNLLAEMGFAYTTRLGEVIPLLPGLNRLKASQSLCYSTRAGWRRFASALWNKYLYGRLRETDLVRLSLHPRDLEFPLMRRQIDQILRASLKRGFQPTTYGDYVAR